MSQCFLKRKFLGGNEKVELNLPNYATKADLKNTSGGDLSDFAKKTDLTNLKPSVDKLDIDKLKSVASGLNSLKNKVDKVDVDKLVPVSGYLSSLSDVVKTDVVKKVNMVNWLKKFIILKLLILVIQLKKTEYNAKINGIENKIPTSITR